MEWFYEYNDLAKQLIRACLRIELEQSTENYYIFKHKCIYKHTKIKR